MASINIDTKLKDNLHPDAPSGGQPKREACIQLLNQWLADESGYDEANWPRVKRMLEENRTSDRPLFNE